MGDANCVNSLHPTAIMNLRSANKKNCSAEDRIPTNMYKSLLEVSTVQPRDIRIPRKKLRPVLTHKIFHVDRFESWLKTVPKWMLETTITEENKCVELKASCQEESAKAPQKRKSEAISDEQPELRKRKKVTRIPQESNVVDVLEGKAPDEEQKTSNQKDRDRYEETSCDEQSDSSKRKSALEEIARIPQKSGVVDMLEKNMHEEPQTINRKNIARSGKKFCDEQPEASKTKSVLEEITRIPEKSSVVDMLEKNMHEEPQTRNRKNIARSGKKFCDEQPEASKRKSVLEEITRIPQKSSVVDMLEKNMHEEPQTRNRKNIARSGKKFCDEQPETSKTKSMLEEVARIPQKNMLEKNMHEEPQTRNWKDIAGSGKKFCDQQPEASKTKSVLEEVARIPQKSGVVDMLEKNMHEELQIRNQKDKARSGKKFYDEQPESSKTKSVPEKITRIPQKSGVVGTLEAKSLDEELGTGFGNKVCIERREEDNGKDILIEADEISRERNNISSAKEWYRWTLQLTKSRHLRIVGKVNNEAWERSRDISACHRLDARTLRHQDGKVYKLVGKPSHSAAVPAFVQTKFASGVPPDWLQVKEQWQQSLEAEVAAGVHNCSVVVKQCEVPLILQAWRPVLELPETLRFTGFLRRDKEHTTERVEIRKGSYSFCCRDGTMYVLEGSMSNTDSLPAQIQKAMAIGLPYRWKKMVKSWANLLQLSDNVSYKRKYVEKWVEEATDENLLPSDEEEDAVADDSVDYEEEVQKIMKEATVITTCNQTPIHEYISPLLNSQTPLQRTPSYTPVRPPLKAKWIEKHIAREAKSFQTNNKTPEVKKWKKVMPIEVKFSERIGFATSSHDELDTSLWESSDTCS